MNAFFVKLIKNERASSLALIIAFLSISHFSIAQTALEPEDAIKAYEFQGMKFGTNIQTFKQKYPLALIYKDSEPKNGLYVFYIDPMKSRIPEIARRGSLN